MRLDGRKDFQAIKSALSDLHVELKAHVLPHYRGMIKDTKRTHEHIHTMLMATKRSRVVAMRDSHP